MTKTVPVLPSRGSQSSGGDRKTMTTRTGQGLGQGTQRAVGGQSEKVREGFLGKETSEMCRISEARSGKEGRTMCKGYKKELARHTPGDQRASEWLMLLPSSGNFAPPGDIWQHLKTFLVIATGEGRVYYQHLVCRGQRCC